MGLFFHTASGRASSDRPAARQANTKPRPYQGKQGFLLLQLLCDHSPALFEAMDNQSAGALPALLWASPRRDAFINTRKLDVECPNPDGEKLWLRAAQTGDYPGATRKLMQAGANILARDAQGQDALSIMADRHHNKAMGAMLDELSSVKQGELSPAKKKEGKKKSFRVEKAKPAARRTLNWKLKDVLGARDSAGRTGLMRAIEQGNRYGVFLLTQSPDGIDSQDGHGRTALMRAAGQGDAYAGLRALRQNPATNLQDAQGKTALMHWVSTLHQTNAPENPPPGLMERAIMAVRGQKPVAQVFSEKLLNASKQYPNLQDAQGKTALHYLLSSPALESPVGLQALETLIQGGASPDIQDGQGITPLMLFARHTFQDARKQAELTTQWLRKPQDINRQDRNGKTTLAHALESGNIGFARQLVRERRPPRNAFLLLPEEAAEFLNPNIQDSEGYTALMRLSELPPTKWEPSVWDALDRVYGSSIPSRQLDPKHPFESIARSLVRAGTNLRKINSSGEDALAIAAKRGNLPVVRVLARNVEVIDDWDRNGRSALQIAALSNQPEVVQELALAGANINRKDIFGKTSLQLAQEQGNKDVIRMLKQLDGQQNRLGKKIQLET